MTFPIPKTGTAPLFPRAFHGFIQSKERYKTAQELADMVREHRRRGLPLDVIVQDWLYWGGGMDRWSRMRHDPEAYGDLPAAVRDAELLLVRSVTNVNAAMLDGSAVKFVATATIGTDHIDEPYLAGKGIGFASAAGSNANSVAEYIVAALRELARRQKFQLRNKTLGIVGGAS